MNAQQEIVARIGADTSGFRKGVDDVATQTARMKNDMKVAFAAGTAGAGQVRGALKGMLDVAGQSGGPLGRMLGGIQDIFRAFQANPIAGMVAAIGSAVVAAGRIAEQAADAALEKTRAAVQEMRFVQSLGRILMPEVFDERFKFAEKMQGMVKAGDLASVQKQLKEEESSAADTYIKLKNRSLTESERAEAIKAAESQRMRIDMLKAAESEIKKDKEKQADDVARAKQKHDKDQERRNEDMARAQEENARAQRDLQIEQASLADPSGRAALRLRAQFVREDYAKAQGLKDSLDPMVRLEAQRESLRLEKEYTGLQIESMNISKQRKQEREAEASEARNTLGLRRDLQIEQALSKDKKGREALKLREQFLREDITSARGRLSSPDISERKAAMDELIRLQAEAVKLQREIKQNTKGGARA